MVAILHPALFTSRRIGLYVASDACGRMEIDASDAETVAAALQGPSWNPTSRVNGNPRLVRFDIRISQCNAQRP
eukprot:788792-Amphidinium_carterae.1